MNNLILILVLVSCLFYAKECDEFVIPAILGTITILLIVKNKEYMSTTDEVDYVEKLKEYCCKVIDENVKEIPVTPYNSSFTEDKKKIFVCVKDKKGNFFNKNDMMYVMLHEYAHATTKVKEDPHGPAWRKNFDRYLKIAEEKGLYDSSIKLSMEYMSECTP